MNICIATYGSRGDVQPILALCRMLRKEGHRVSLAAPPENRKWASSFRIPFFSLGDPFMAFTDRHPDVHTLKPAAAFLRFLRTQAEKQFEQLPRFVRGADLALGCSLTFGLPSVAEAMSVPYRYVAFCPQVFRSENHPSLFVRNHRMPKVLNRLSWKIDGLADRLLFRTVIDRFRRRSGLSPLSLPTLDHLLGSRPLLAAERVLAPLPGDAGRTIVRIGYPKLAGGGRLPRSVVRFLEEGPPPVYFGFGSMPHGDRRKTLSRIVAAGRRAAVRVMVSWGREERVADDCLLVGPVDHGRLFPRTAAVIHHGGAGTTTTAARAGVPQILVPHVLDQFYWARRVADLEVGPAPVLRRRLRTGGLSRRIAAVSDGPRFLDRARKLAGDLGGGPEARQVVLRIVA